MEQEDFRVTELEIGKLELRAGDVLAVRYINNVMPSMYEMERVATQLRGVLPSGVDVVVFRNDVELTVIKLKEAQDAATEASESG